MPSLTKLIDLISRSIAEFQFMLYRPEIQGTIYSIDCREQGSHTRLGTARAKREEEADS